MTVIRIGMDNLPDPDVVEIFDHKFTVRRVTRSVQRGLEAADKKINAALEAEDSDKIFTAIAEGVNVLLEPNGKQTQAKTVLIQSWKDDQLSLGQLRQLYDGVQESAVKVPPTSPPAT